MRIWRQSPLTVFFRSFSSFVHHHHHDVRSWQLVSDLHLNFLEKPSVNSIHQCLKQNVPPPHHHHKCNLLVAGDVAPLNWSYWPLVLQYFSRHWYHTYIVPGNHEWYFHNEHQFPTADYFQDTTLLPWHHFHGMYQNVEFLHKKYKYFPAQNQYEIPALHLLGTTLWSFLPNHTFGLSDMIDDFRHITTLQHMNDEQKCHMYNYYHQADVRWLKKMITHIKYMNPQSHRDRFLFFTHHAPVFINKEKQQQQTWKEFAFSSHVYKIFQYHVNPAQTMWCFGHVHDNKEWINPQGTHFMTHSQPKSSDSINIFEW
jgi:hypothetical protein